MTGRICDYIQRQSVILYGNIQRKFLGAVLLFGSDTLVVAELVKASARFQVVFKGVTTENISVFYNPHMFLSIIYVFCAYYCSSNVCLKFGHYGQL